MCGRTCMTLNSDEIKCACKYKESKSDKEKKPDYRNEFNLGKKYTPSYNLAPSQVCPIIVSSKHFDEEQDSANRTVIPALWSLIPKWHKGDHTKHGLTTNNARLENVEHSKLYKPLLERGKRCVMVIEGFYEWKTTDKKAKSSERKVYFIHMPQINEHIKMEDKSTWTCENIKLLHIAGLFDVWHDENGDSIFSFTIITYESNELFGWLHHRTPAILETEEQIRDWLDFERVSKDDALKLLRQPKVILWYEVSNYVNSTKNQSDKCKQPIDHKAAASASKSGIMRWLKKKAVSSDDEEKVDDDGDENNPKRKKLD